MPIQTSGVTRPPSLIGQPDPNEKKNQKYLTDGAGQYTGFTPVLTAGVGFAYGANSYQIARFKRIGSQCDFYFKIFLGNAGFAAGAATTWTISLPIMPMIEQSPQLWDNVIPGGAIYLNPNGGNAPLGVPLLTPNTRSFQILVGGSPSGSRVTGTLPVWNGAGGGSLEGGFVYEVSGL